MKNKDYFVLWVIVAIAFCIAAIFSSCTMSVPVNPDGTPVVETPKERAIQWLVVYNSTYEDYKRQAARTDLTEAERTVLRSKYEILVEIYPFLCSYIEYVNAGTIPPLQLEAMIRSQLTSLERLIATGDL